MIRTKLNEAEEQFAKTKESLESGIQLLEDMKKSYKEKQDRDKQMDKNFKREFPGKNKHNFYIIGMITSDQLNEGS